MAMPPGPFMFNPRPPMQGMPPPRGMMPPRMQPPVPPPHGRFPPPGHMPGPLPGQHLGPRMAPPGMDPRGGPGPFGGPPRPPPGPPMMPEPDHRDREREQREDDRKRKQEDHADSNALYLRGLGGNTDEKQIREAFERLGPPVRDVIIRKRKDGDNVGFAFVVYNTAADVETVMNATKGVLTIDGRKVTMELSHKYKVDSGQPSKRDKQSPSRGDNWVCKKCSYDNFPHRGTCFKCDTPRNETGSSGSKEPPRQDDRRDSRRPSPPPSSFNRHPSNPPTNTSAPYPAREPDRYGPRPPYDDRERWAERDRAPPASSHWPQDRRDSRDRPPRERSPVRQGDDRWSGSRHEEYRRTPPRDAYGRDPRDQRAPEYPPRDNRDPRDYPRDEPRKEPPRMEMQRPSRPPAENPPPQEPARKVNRGDKDVVIVPTEFLLVRGLKPYTGINNVLLAFDQWKLYVVDVRLVREKVSGASCCFAFVQFLDHVAATSALYDISAKSDWAIQGAVVTVTYGNNNSMKQASTPEEENGPGGKWVYWDDECYPEYYQEGIFGRTVPGQAPPQQPQGAPAAPPTNPTPPVAPAAATAGYYGVPAAVPGQWPQGATVAQPAHAWPQQATPAAVPTMPQQWAQQPQQWAPPR